MAVAALLHLKNQRALAFQRGCTLQETVGHGIAAPGVHVRTPGSESGKMRERSQRHRDQQDAQHRDRPAAPAFFPFAEYKRQEYQRENRHHRPDQESGRLQRRRKQGEQCIHPQKEIIGARSGLNDGGIGPSARPEWPEIDGASRYRGQNEGGEEQILPYRVRNKGLAILFHQLFILGRVRRAFHKASGHGPIVDAQLQHHQEMQAHQANQHPGNHENVEREKTRKRGAGNNRAAEHEFYGGGPQDRHAAGDGSADSQPPIGVLVES